MFKKGLGDLVSLQLGNLGKNWLEWGSRNHTGTGWWLAQDPRLENLDFILKVGRHLHELLSRGLARPDVVSGNTVLVVSLRK